MNPFVFKIILTVVFSFGVISLLHSASKGKHSIEVKPGGQAIGAVILTLLAIAVWWVF